MSTKKRKPQGSAMEEFVFGTKEKEAAPLPTLLRCIASTTSIPGSGNTANTHNTLRFIANRHTTWACKHLHHNRFPFNQRSLV
jgi:hypothetical protein